MRSHNACIMCNTFYTSAITITASNRETWGLKIEERDASTHLTGMVDKPGLVARHRSIHYIICIYPEHVATNALWKTKPHSPLSPLLPFP